MNRILKAFGRDLENRKSKARQELLNYFWWTRNMSEAEETAFNHNHGGLLSCASFGKSSDWGRYEQLLSQAERGLTMKPKGHPQGIELFSPSGQRFYFPYPTTPANQRATIVKEKPIYR